MSTNSELKVLHDGLLAEMPEGAVHDSDHCPMCALEDVDNNATTDGGGLMPEAFTQDDINAAVDAATSDLTKRLSELGAQVQETEIGRAVAEAKAEAETKVAELQDQLDAAVAARTAAETKLSEAEQYWTDAIAAQEAAAALDQVKAARVAAAKETGALPEDYILANADRFAAKSAEDFDACIAEWKLVAESAKGTPFAAGATRPPSTTALEASAAPSNTGKTKLSLIHELRESRFDPRAMGGAV